MELKWTDRLFTFSLRLHFGLSIASGNDSFIITARDTERHMVYYYCSNSFRYSSAFPFQESRLPPRRLGLQPSLIWSSIMVALQPNVLIVSPFRWTTPSHSFNSYFPPFRWVQCSKKCPNCDRCCGLGNLIKLRKFLVTNPGSTIKIQKWRSNIQIVASKWNLSSQKWENGYFFII